MAETILSVTGIQRTPICRADLLPSGELYIAKRVDRMMVRVGQAIAGDESRERKVRALQDRMVGNADRSRDQGKCHRKQTAG
jgi:hypothetical protein